MFFRSYERIPHHTVVHLDSHIASPLVSLLQQALNLVYTFGDLRGTRGVFREVLSCWALRSHNQCKCRLTTP